MEPNHEQNRLDARLALFANAHLQTWRDLGVPVTGRFQIMTESRIRHAEDSYIVLDADLQCEQGCVQFRTKHFGVTKDYHFIVVRVPCYDTTRMSYPARRYPEQPSEQTVLYELWQALRRGCCEHLQKLPDDAPAEMFGLVVLSDLVELTR